MICLFFVVLLSAQTPEEYKSSTTAEHWMSMCHPLLGASVQTDGRISISNRFDIGQCAGALDAISVLIAIRNDSGRPVLAVCPPHERTIFQWVALFTNYTKSHPKQYGEPFALVMLAALQDAYPCRK
jgi:hypothetical protein